MSPETAVGRLGRKLQHQRKVYHELFSQSFYIKEGRCPLVSTSLSSTTTMVEHEDKDFKASTKSGKIEEETLVKHDEEEEIIPTETLTTQAIEPHHYRKLTMIPIRLWRIPVTRDDEWRDLDSLSTKEYVSYTLVAQGYVQALKRVRQEEKYWRMTVTERSWLTSWMDGYIDY